MRLLLLAITSLLATTTLALPNTTTILSSSNCNYVDSTDTIDCSAVTSVDEILAAMGELGAAGQTEITGFLLVGNPHVTHLQQDMLGEIQFKQITITDNPNLTSCGDILGVSKNSVLHLDLSKNKLSYLPRMESSSLNTYKQNSGDLASIAQNALNAVPNLQVIELRAAGLYNDGVVIGDGAFMHLPILRELDMYALKVKDDVITKGSFTFNSPYLQTVDLTSDVPATSAEIGSFGGFNANATLSIMVLDMLQIETFYNVFNSGARVLVKVVGNCGCKVDWIRFSCFLPLADIPCFWKYGQRWNLADIPAEHFSECCFGPTYT